MFSSSLIVSYFFLFLETGSLLTIKRAPAASIIASTTAIIDQLIATELLLLLEEVLEAVLLDCEVIDVLVCELDWVVDEEELTLGPVFEL